jgi:UDPglucose 6-dehydrogenase
MKYKIGIIGSSGMVGGSLKKYFQKKENVELYLYDINGEGSKEQVNKADYVFIAVPTPTNESGECQLIALFDAVGRLSGEKVVIVKSTITPGTTQILQEKYPQHKFLFNPEFLTESTADQDMCYPDRQIVGYTKESFTIAKDIMMLLPLAPYERIIPASEAEMVKYMGNTWFATKVVFANQIYDLCQRIGVDYDKVKEACSADKRIGVSHLEIFHKGGRGFSGKCLPKDTKALIGFATNRGINMSILKEVDKYNEEIRKAYGNGK